MKIIIAIDSFKGAAPSKQLNLAAKEAVLEVLPNADVETFSIADGGEGTMEAMADKCQAKIEKVSTTDLMGRAIMAPYLKMGDRAFIESAKVIGIDKITPSQESFSQATSFGLGALCLDAIDKGCQELFIGLGGSGSSDGGRGFLESLSFDVTTCQLTEPGILKKTKIHALADVTNPYAGSTGFAKIFGPQKGGSPKQIETMDQEAQAFVERVKTCRGLNLQKVAGSGAAGGMGGAIAILGGEILPGFDTIAALLGLEKEMADADLILTGEGKLDGQSKAGKVPVAISRMGQKYQCPTIALCGSVEDDSNVSEEFLATFAIQRKCLSLKEALDNKTTLSNLKALVSNLMKTRYL
ncbi:glycerate kinase [Streptococcus iniae]|uniref:glycerate kinase family protein n=1 Tax=Streptococcus iniae TaxID=1346 RepID=UPI000EFC6D00|nr:glycerate kinase [Streptococcus iniae]RMI74096.1 glycerate kinase [Streptococcus iniae]